MAIFGLIGKDISYSFSKPYFEAFFKEKKLSHEYLNFSIESISEFPRILEKHPTLKGLNVTIPFKQQIIPYLDKIDKEAQAIGAVNTIKITRSGNLVGYNTDHYGFATSLAEHLPLKEKTALIIGTGGASKAIAYVLKSLGFKYAYISRTADENEYTYEQVTEKLIQDHKLLINCTPLGTGQYINSFPKLPYKAITKDHLLFDLNYNPKLTIFLKMGKDQGARIVNGEKMLEHQAKKAWKIWK